MNVHKNARLTPCGRGILISRLERGEHPEDDFGFLREAYGAGKYAMDRLRWSKHWAREIRDATNEVDLWRYAVLLTKIVDGRFHQSEMQNGHNSAMVKRYGSTFNDLIRRRIDNWKSKREKSCSE